MIEKEALAIVWATEKLRQFLLGRYFRIYTDHRPLEFILDPNKPLPHNTSARLQRWAIKLARYDYKILYTKPITLQHPDCLSRIEVAAPAETNLHDEYLNFQCSVIEKKAIAQ